MPGPTLLRDLAREVRDDRVLGLAAEIAFFTMLSLFPGLLVAAALIGYLDVVVGADVAARSEDQVTDALLLVLGDQGSSLVDSVRAVFEGRFGGLLTIATLGALVTLSGAWAVVIEALNHAYDIDEHRSWARRRLLGLVLGLTTVVVVVVALSVVVVGPLLGRGDDVADVVGLGAAFAAFWDVARYPVLFVVVALWLALVYHVAPNRRTAWRSSPPGALTTTVLWLLATVGFSVYLRVVGEGNPLLGALGGGVVMLTWVYLLSIALLLGGEVNGLLRARRQETSRPGS